MDAGQSRGHQVKRVWLEPDVSIHPAVADAMRRFDAVIIGHAVGFDLAVLKRECERTGIGWAGACRRNIDRLVQYVKESEHLALDPLVRHKLASLEIETRLARLFCYYMEWMREKGLDPVWESSLAKGFAGDVSVRIAEAGIQILGLYGQLDKGSRWAPLDGAIEQAYLSYPSWTIAAGSPEIQKNIIATIGLGLPR